MTRITRREWLAAGGLALSSACRKDKTAGFPGYALIATAGETSVAVVDLMTFRLLKQVELGAAPSEISTGRDRSFVVTPSSGTVHVLNEEFERVSSHKLSDKLSAIRLTADSAHLVAIAPGSRELIVADAASMKSARRYRLSASPVNLDLAGPYAAVSTGTGGGVELFHLESGQHWRAQLTGQTGAVRFRADGRILLAATLTDPTLTAMQVPSLETVAALPLAMRPENLCFNADQGQLFVSGQGMDAVAIVFPYNVLEVEQTVLAGRDPGAMACSGRPAYLFVASNSGSDVSVMSVNSRKVVGVVKVGLSPSFITVTPDNQYALVMNQGSEDMSVIRVNSIRANREKSGASLFTMLQVGARPVFAAIVPKPLG